MKGNGIETSEKKKWKWAPRVKCEIPTKSPDKRPLGINSPWSQFLRKSNSPEALRRSRGSKMHGYRKACEVNQGDSKTSGCKQKLVIIEGDEFHDGREGGWRKLK